MDGVGFDFLNEDFVDFIDKMKCGLEVVEDFVNYYVKLNKKEYLKIGYILKVIKLLIFLYFIKIEYIKLEDLEKKFSSFMKFRFSVMWLDKDKNVNNDKKEGFILVLLVVCNGKIKVLSLSIKDVEKCKWFGNVNIK